MNARLKVQNPESDSGSPVFEEIPAEAVEDGLVRVLNSPVLVENLAADDIIRAHADGSFEVVKRAGNICIQFFRSKPPNIEVEQVLRSRVEDLGGRLDVRGGQFLVYTVPLRPAGFAAIEEPFNEAVGSSPDSSWMFGNVYDPVDGSPLNWWT